MTANQKRNPRRGFDRQQRENHNTSSDVEMIFQDLLEVSTSEIA
jgi:hypothetical protein